MYTRTPGTCDSLGRSCIMIWSTESFRTEALGRPDHDAAAPQAVAGARRARVHGQPAADQPRRAAGRTKPVSVHPAGYGHGGAVPVGADFRREGARPAGD